MMALPGPALQVGRYSRKIPVLTKARTRTDVILMEGQDNNGSMPQPVTARSRSSRSSSTSSLHIVRQVRSMYGGVDLALSKDRIVTKKIAARLLDKAAAAN